MEVVAGKVLGRLTDGWWAQVHDFVAEGNKVHRRGRLIAVTSLHQNELDQMETVTMGREILARLHELYFGDSQDEPLVALKKAGQVLAEEFTGVEVVAVALVNKVVYVLTIGGGGVWMRTDGQEGWLVDSARSETTPVTLSGWAKDNQTYVLGNSKFWQALTLGAIRAAVSNSTSAVDAAESLAAVVHGNDSGIGSVGTVVHVAQASTSAITTHTSPPPSVAEIPKVAPAKLVDRFRTQVAKLIPKPAGPIFVSHGDKTKSRRKTMYLGIGFLAILFLVVGGWQWRRTVQANQTSVYNQQVEEVVHQFNEARALVDLNPVRSRQLLAEVDAQVKKLAETKKGQKDERLANVTSDFGQVLGAATGVKPVQPSEVLDLNWIRPDMVGSRLALAEGKLVVLDNQANRLALVNPDKKSGEILAGVADLGRTTAVASYPGKIMVASDKGLIECLLPQFKCTLKVETAATVEIKDMAMFAGNIYILNSSGVFRHQVIDSGFSAAADWLAEDEDKSQFSSSSNLAIDAYIWVMQTDSQIYKYSRGVKDNFSVADLDKPFASQAILYTDADAEKLYVLDKGNGRVVVLNKTGAYESQYQFDQAKEAADIGVDEKAGLIYVLSGSKIWSIKL
ncbi:MAG: hypothetical protein Q7S31_00025 [bacterium]|nr:hypothetical protein [bacterium]